MKKVINKNFFEAVNPKVDFVSLEERILKYWYSKGIVKRYLSKNKNSKKIFSFLDGPITANNPMGVHHAWGRTYKDLWQRFYNMLGFRQRFQNGFDCQGLWVEVEVEKELGLKSKKEIENLVPNNKKKSIAKFVNLCKKRVYKYAKIQTQQSIKLGYFLDWENSYFTLSDDNNYMIWYFLKKCHELGLIYKGTDVVPWCPRCETAISEHEILTEDYREVTHESLYLAFPLKGRNNEFLCVWTTTPWTVPANVSIAVRKDLDYQLIEKGGKLFWVAKKLAKVVFGEKVKVLKTVKGEKLEAFRYLGPFDDIAAISNFKDKSGFHQVVITDDRILPVSGEEGTGLVHVSTGTGSEDHKLGKKLNLPIIPAIEDDGSYLPEYGFLSGKNAKKNPHIIIDYLKKYKGGQFLYKTQKYTHRYPVCWRCKTELVFKLTDEWYISMDKKIKEFKNLSLREKMIEVAKEIRWIPEFGLERELDWLKNMHDWLISKKNRFWGLALPIWECKNCLNFEVIGGKGELRRKAVEGWEKFEGHTPHKPHIDEVKILCRNCGGKMERIPDVGNPWLDAGIVPFSTISSDNKGSPLYWKNKMEWEKWFPADFITESFPGQFKNWFYSLIAMSTVLEGRKPFKTVLGFATLLAEDGRPMHKSWGNAIEFNEGAKKIGVDVMRFMYSRQNPSENLLFGYRTADETRRRFHIKLWNIYNFFVTYANLDGFKPKREFKYGKSMNILDIWILAKLRTLSQEVTKDLFDYNACSASLKIENFINDFSNWYIRNSRVRVGVAKTSKLDAMNFYRTCYYVLVNLVKLLAPFNPFISDVIYINLTKKQSVHLTDWPNLGKVRKSDLDVIKNMEVVRQLTELAHSIRKRERIALRQPLKVMLYFIKGARNGLSEEFEDLLKNEINVKEVMFSKFGRNMKGRWSSSVSESDLGEMRVSLNLDITSDLEEESKARELIRKIQVKRKEMGINIHQKVVVYSPWLPMSKKIYQMIKKKTFTVKLIKGDFKVKVVN